MHHHLLTFTKSIVSAIHADPKQRISLEMVANHPWVVMEEGRIIPFSCKCQNENAAEESTSQAEKHSLLPT